MHAENSGSPSKASFASDAATASANREQTIAGMRDAFEQALSDHEAKIAKRSVDYVLARALPSIEPDVPSLQSGLEAMDAVNNDIEFARRADASADETELKQDAVPLVRQGAPIDQHTSIMPDIAAQTANVSDATAMSGTCLTGGTEARMASNGAQATLQDTTSINVRASHIAAVINEHLQTNNARYRDVQTDVHWHFSFDGRNLLHEAPDQHPLKFTVTERDGGTTVTLDMDEASSEEMLKELRQRLDALRDGIDVDSGCEQL